MIELSEKGKKVVARLKQEYELLKSKIIKQALLKGSLSRICKDEHFHIDEDNLSGCLQFHNSSVDITFYITDLPDDTVEQIIKYNCEEYMATICVDFALQNFTEWHSRMHNKPVNHSSFDVFISWMLDGCFNSYIYRLQSVPNLFDTIYPFIFKNNPAENDNEFSNLINIINKVSNITV